MTKHSYTIDLDIKGSQQLKQVQKSLSASLGDSAKNLKQFEATYEQITEGVKDTTELEKVYLKTLDDAIKKSDKKLDALKAQQIALKTNTKLTDEERKNGLQELDSKIRQLKISKGQLEVQRKYCSVARNQSKIQKQLLDQQQNELKNSQKLSRFIKDDLKALKEKVKEQLKFISALKTTEGRYNAIKKVTGFGLRAGKNIAKAGIVAGIGGFVGATTSVINNAETYAEKDRAIKSLKSGITPDLIDQVYIKTGASYETIVAALNNLSDITKDNGLLVQGAVQEVQHAGFGRALLSTTKQSNTNISQLTNGISQIMKSTGSQDMTAALAASMNSRTVNTGRVSQVDYLNAYSALAQRGLDEETINRVINRIARKGGSFVDEFNKTDVSKFVRGSLRSQLINSPIKLESIDVNKSASKSSAESLVEKLRQLQLKKDELLVKLLPIVETLLDSLNETVINDIICGLQRMIPIIANVLGFVGRVVTDPEGTIWTPLKQAIKDAIRDPVVSLVDSVKGFITEGGLFSTLFKNLLSIISPISVLMDFIMGNGFYDKIASLLWSGVSRAITFIKDAFFSVLSKLPFIGDDIAESANPSGGARAQGGLVTSPTICGEAGAELVIPLDNSRAGRAGQIINNFNTNQSFNMQGNQQTPLAFSQAIGQNKYIMRFNGL